MVDDRMEAEAVGFLGQLIDQYILEPNAGMEQFRLMSAHNPWGILIDGTISWVCGPFESG
jgi:hypothetical protein